MKEEEKNKRGNRKVKRGFLMPEIGTPHIFYRPSNRWDRRIGVFLIYSPILILFLLLILLNKKKKKIIFLSDKILARFSSTEISKDLFEFLLGFFYYLNKSLTFYLPIAARYTKYVCQKEKKKRMRKKKVNLGTKFNDESKIFAQRVKEKGFSYPKNYSSFLLFQSSFVIFSKCGDRH